MARRIEKFITREEIISEGKRVSRVEDARERSYQISKYARQKLREGGDVIDFLTMEIEPRDGGIVVSAEVRGG